MTKQMFQPKDADTLKSEIINDLEIDYEGNEDMVDKLVDRGLKDEQFKASLHEEKKKHLDTKDWYKDKMVKAGFDPKTGERLAPEVKANGGVERENYSLKDIRALSDVHDEDVEEIADFAKHKKISIAEAKANPIMQIYLKNRTEERATAAATHTGTGRKGASGVSDNDLVEKAKRGEEVDFEKLAQARINQKKQDLKK